MQCYRSFQLLFEQSIPFTRRAKVQLYLFFHEHDKKSKGSTYTLAFMNMIRRERVQHLDVVMKLFALSLEEEAIDWFTSLLDNSISTLAQCENAFFEKWGEH